MSKYMKQEERSSIPSHRHCAVCWTPITMEREFCGPNCQDEFKRAERKRKYTFIPILIIFPLLVFIILTL